MRRLRMYWCGLIHGHRAFMPSRLGIFICAYCGAGFLPRYHGEDRLADVPDADEGAGS